MSFTSIFSTVKKVGLAIMGAEHAAAPLLKLAPGIGGFIGVLDDVFQRIQGTIAVVEANSPMGGGQLKSAAVVNDFEAGLGLTQSILAADGKMLQYDDKLLQEAINAQVAAFNSFAALKASFKVVSLAK